MPWFRGETCWHSSGVLPEPEAFVCFLFFYGCSIVNHHGKKHNLGNMFFVRLRILAFLVLLKLLGAWFQTSPFFAAQGFHQTGRSSLTNWIWIRLNGSSVHFFRFPKDLFVCPKNTGISPNHFEMTWVWDFFDHQSYKRSGWVWGCLGTFFVNARAGNWAWWPYKKSNLNLKSGAVFRWVFVC